MDKKPYEHRLMRPRMMTRYLVQQIRTGPLSWRDFAVEIVEIRQMVTWLMKEYGYEIEVKRLEYTEALCTVAATIIGSAPLFQRMAVEPDSQPARSPNDISHSALIALAYLGDKSRLKTLIDAGVDVNIGSKVMGSPLHAAAAGGHTEIVVLLLECGADVNLKIDGWGYTAIDLAGLAGHEEIVRILLNPKHGIRLNDEAYQMAVLSAVRGGNVDLMQLVVKFRPTAHSPRFKYRMLLEASDHGAVNVVRSLVDGGVDVNQRDYHPFTPLQRAASGGHGETVQLLLARGARLGKGRTSPLCQAAKRGYERVVQILLDAGDDIHGGHGSWQDGPLTAAVKNEEIQMIQYLLAKGIDPHDKSTQTALSLAAERGYERTVRMLAAYGVNVNTHDDMPMLSALKYGHDNVVETLLEFGAQKIDVSKCRYAAEFASGQYPHRRLFRY